MIKREAQPPSEIQEGAWFEACRLSIDLLCYSGNIYPHNNLICRMAKGRIVSLAIEFAVHARRCLDATNARPQLGEPLWVISIPANTVIETDLRSILNRIIHANYLEVAFGAVGEGVRYTDAGDAVATHLITRTDLMEEAYSEIHSMAWCFLLYADQSRMMEQIFGQTMQTVPLES